MLGQGTVKRARGGVVQRLRDGLSGIFGTHVVSSITKNEVKRVRTLQQDAAETTSIVKPFAEIIAQRLKLDPKAAVTEPRLKKLDRIFEKAIGRHSGQFEEVHDVIGLRILVEKPEDIMNLRKMFLGNSPVYEGRNGALLNHHPNNEITVREFEDFFLRPSSTGRVAVHMKLDVRLTGGHSVPYEIQVIHKDMQDTEIFTHDNYQKAEEINRMAMSQKRPLTEDEKHAVEGYHASNRERYKADSLNYGLSDLRHLSLQKADLALAYAV